MVMITEWWREIERKWPGPHPPQILRSIKFKCPWYSDEWVCLKRGGVLGRFSWRWDFLLNRVYEYDGWEGECSFEVRVFMKTNRLPPPRRGRGGSGTPEEAIPLVEAAAPEDAIGLFAAGY